jgi:Hypoxia induced protein conserved region
MASAISAGHSPQTRAETYSKVMHGFLAVLVGMLMLATLGVLIAGMIGMVREGSPRRSNKLMQLRVLLQGAAILLFIILMSLLRS